MAKIPAVLIVDENDDNRVEVRKLLNRAGLEVAGEARYGASATAAATEFRPDAIVVGIEDPPNRPLETVEALSQLLLETPIIGYSSLAEPEAVRRATRAGVRDYLVRPLGAEALREAVFAALAQEERRQLRRAGHINPTARGSVITVSGAKGGIGKSAVAINLAVALRQVTGRSVALVDADTHFGDVATLLSVSRERSVTEVVAIAGELDRRSVVEQAVEHSSGVAVFPGPVDPEAWDAVRLDDVDRLVGLLGEAYDFVVIDTPDVFDGVVKQCLTNSTLTLLITSLDISSMSDTRAALRVLMRWEYPVSRVRLVANNTRRQNSLREADVHRAVGLPVFWTVPYDKRAPEVAQLGESLLSAKPKSEFSRSFHDLAKLVSGGASAQSNQSRAGAVRRLFGRLPTIATTG